MNVIRKENVDSNNGWGFGGMKGTITEYDNGLIEVRGRYHHRHTGTSSANFERIRIDDDFELKIDGQRSNKITIFRYDDNYYATYKDISTFTRFGMDYEIFKVVNL